MTGGQGSGDTHGGDTPSGPRDPGGSRAASTGAGGQGGDRHDGGAQARRDAWRGVDQGSIMSVELLTATLVWFGIGWLVDQLLGTGPWFMFAGALLGNWVGLYLLWVRGQRAEAGAHAPATGPPVAPAGDDPDERAG